MIANRLAPVLLVAALSAACAGYDERRALMKELEDDEIILRGSPAQFRAGTRVAFVRDDCTPSTVEGIPPACIAVRVGEGTVERVVDAQHVLVRVDPGVSLRGVSRVIPAKDAPPGAR